MQAAIISILVYLSLKSIELTTQTKDTSVLTYVNYEVDTFHRLATHRISSFLVKSMEDCAMACLNHVECFSFNLGNPIKGEHECELIRTDKYNSNLTYNNSTDFHHFFIKNPCGTGKALCKNAGTCYPVYEDNNFQCVCPSGYTGRHCENREELLAARSCLEWLENGYNESRVYSIKDERSGDSSIAYCDMTLDGGGWVVILRRKDGSVDFDLPWSSYRQGFGDLMGEFWFGLTKALQLFAIGDHELRIDLEDWEGNTAYAKYNYFGLTESSSSGYRLTVESYSGTAGDTLASANGMQFTTKDADHDNNPDANCAILSRAGWWFNNCFQALLTGPYSLTPQGGKGIVWKHWKGFNYSLKGCEMKMRPRKT